MYKSFSGFTLLECLIALMILSTLFLFIGQFIHTTQVIQQQLQRTKEKEWEVFLIQLEYELKDDYFVKVEDNTLYLKSERGEEVLIQPYQTMVRKRKNGGHQPMLTDVASFTLRKEKEQIQLEVVFLNGYKRWGQWEIQTTA